VKKQITPKIISNGVEIDALTNAPKNTSLRGSRQENRKLPTLGNSGGEIGSSENAMLSIRQCVQDFAKLSKGLHAANPTNPFTKCNDLQSPSDEAPTR
jgi:hypothetical protein